MGERDKPDKEPPTFNLESNGEVYEARRENTALYTFLGELATRNHIIHAEQNEDGENNMVVLFTGADHYDEYIKKMEEESYMMYLNLPHVPPQCEWLYQNMVENQKRIDQLVEDESRNFPDEFNLEDWK